MLNGKTQVFGVIGHPISHTASPAMHNAGYQVLGVDAVYVPFHVLPESLETAIAAVKALKISGLNVTIPHKEQVMRYLDHIDPLAKRIGAVNTIVNNNGQLVGYNTDGLGFLVAIEEELSFKWTHQNVVLLGAGGAARGIAFALLEHRIASLTILNRTVEKALELCQQLELNANFVPEAFSLPPSLTGSQALKTLQKATVIINTTSVGMDPQINNSPVESFEWVTPNQLCCDIIYKPAKTTFLAQAEQRGARIINGSGMLAGQGKLAFKLFTGKDISYQLFKTQV